MLRYDTPFKLIIVSSLHKRRCLLSARSGCKHFAETMAEQR